MSKGVVSKETTVAEPLKSPAAHALADALPAFVQYAIGRLCKLCKIPEEAVSWFHRAALRDLAVAQFQIGRMCLGGQGVPENHGEAAQWLRKAAEQNHATAQVMLGILCMGGTRQFKSDYAEGFKWLRKAGEGGGFFSFLELAVAGNALGRIYEEGIGVEKNYKRAANWYKKAAGRGSVEAQRALGICYAEGKGVEQDDKKAHEFLKEAASLGGTNDMGARLYLAKLFEEGRGVIIKGGEITYNVRDPERVKRIRDWVNGHCQKESVQVQLDLAQRYYEGKHIDQDYTEAAKWFHIVENRADEAKASYEEDLIINAQYHLGLLYKDGHGVQLDEQKAVRYFRTTAELGFAGAQRQLGLCYAEGRGVEKDKDKAYMWLSKAFAYFYHEASQGGPDGRYHVGLMYAHGESVEQNREEAIRWLTLATEQDHVKARKALAELTELTKSAESTEPTKPTEPVTL